MSKHTPGPWRADKFDHSYQSHAWFSGAVRVGDTVDAVAHVRERGDGHTDPACAEQTANLNILAASVDFFEALDGGTDGEQHGPSPLTWLAGVVTEYAVLAEQDAARRVEAGEVVDWEAHFTAIREARQCIERLQAAMLKARGVCPQCGRELTE